MRRADARARSIAAALALAALAGCRERSEPAGSRPAGQPAVLVDLDESLAPVRAAFEARRGENRFLTLLAPT